MKKCNMCGCQVDDKFTTCPNCGNPNLTVDMPVQGQVMQQPVQQPVPGPVPGPVQQPMMGQQPMPGQMMGQQPMPGPMMQPAVNQKGSIGWAVLGFFIPIVGWILYFCWKSSKPGDAKMAGIGGLAGFAFNLVVGFLL